MCLLKKFLKNIESHNSTKTIYFEDREYSYKEILSKAYDLSRILEIYGYRKIFSNLKNSPLSICLYIASWIADIDLFVPINPRLINHELESIIEQNSIFITDKKYLFKDNKIKIILVKDEKSFLEGLPKTNNFTIHQKAITAHISSGTTGYYQKHYHNINQIIKYAQASVNNLGLKNDDHLLVALSINHAFAFSYQILPALAMGLNITLIREFNSKILVKIINQTNITSLALLPTMYYFLLQENITSRNSLRYLSVAGDIFSEKLEALVSQKLNLPLLNGIGMTEVFGYGQNTTVNSNRKIKIFTDTDIKIEKFEKSDYGKIFIKNYMIPLNNIGEWLETGDIGSFDKQTYELTFYGRYKDIIIKGGSNISPIELENVILAINGIKNCVIVGKEDNIWGETIWALLVANNDYSLDFINQNLIEYISEYKKLDGILYIDEIPLTATGKTDRKKLKELINNEA